MFVSQTFTSTCDRAVKTAQLVHIAVKTAHSCENSTISRHSTVALPIGMSHHSQKKKKQGKSLK